MENTGNRAKGRALGPRLPLAGEGQPKSAAADDELPDMVEQASDDSFPASDPPSFTPTRAGRPSEQRQAAAGDRADGARRGERHAPLDSDRREPPRDRD